VDEFMRTQHNHRDHRFANEVLAGTLALMILASSGICSSFAQTASPKPRTPGEIAVASRLIAAKNETCRQEAKAQHLHLLKRRRFMRDCRSRP
jgi:hypothetical protein